MKNTVYCLQAGNQGGCKFPRGRETITIGWNQPPVKGRGDKQSQGETHQQTVQSEFHTSSSHFWVLLFCILPLTAEALKYPCASDFDHFVSCKHSCTCCLPRQGVWRVAGWWDKDQLIMSPQWGKAPSLPWPLSLLLLHFLKWTPCPFAEGHLKF